MSNFPPTKLPARCAIAWIPESGNPTLAGLPALLGLLGLDPSLESGAQSALHRVSVQLSQQSGPGVSGRLEIHFEHPESPGSEHWLQAG